MKECIAMLLAGGQGSRLYALTQNIAKPAIPFGGKYRIIDFPLSNCINSGITTVGVLTQYQPLVLNDYIGNGQPWDLDRLDGGVHILPPYQTADGAGWYKGTANAIYQNLNFIERYQTEHVLVLSGDHIYKMDYAAMLQRHKETGAACTIAVLEVPKEDAHRFGIMAADENGTVTEFEEKPKEPKSNLASMGVYIFRKDLLSSYLKADEANPDSENDFGKNVIPAMLGAGEKMVVHPFEGYWKDVGTIDSLWEANMDMLDSNTPFDVWDKSWRIYGRDLSQPPHLIGEHAQVDSAVIAGGCEVDGKVDFSVLFPGAIVEEGAIVRDSILMHGAHIKKGAQVHYAIVAEDVTVEPGAVVGQRPEEIEDLTKWGVAVVGKGLTVESGTKVPALAMLYEEEGGR